MDRPPAPPSDSGRPQAICVLGMHRSGTSALTRVLNLLGADLGDRLLPAMVGVNDRGFWEHADIERIHNRLLAALGSQWDDMGPLPTDWWKCPQAAHVASELADVIRRDFGGSPLWAVKDPRLCRLLPVWHRLFESLTASPAFVIVLRNPDEVAGSLDRRDGFPRAKSHLLWLVHMLEAERWTRGRPRIVVAYDDVLSDWRGTIEQIGGALAIRWPRCPDEIAHEVGEFLSPDLRHHRAKTASEEGAMRGGWILDVYEAFLAARGAAGFKLPPRLANLHDQVPHAGAIFSPWLDDSGRRLAEMTRQGEALRENLGRLEFHHEHLRRDMEIVRGWLAERTAAADELASRVWLLTAETQMLKGHVGELTAEAGRREALIVEHDAAIVERDVAIVERDVAIAEQKRQIASRDLYYSQLRFRLAERANQALRKAPLLHAPLKRGVELAAAAGRRLRRSIAAPS